MNHYPYFEGDGDEFFPTKTVKTLCNKRVSRGGAELHTHIDCPSCRAALEYRRDNAVLIAREVRAGIAGYASDAESDQRLVTACDKDIKRMGELLAL